MTTPTKKFHITPASKVAEYQKSTAVTMVRSAESRQDFYDRLKKAVDDYYDIIINTCRISIENATKTVSTTPGIIVVDQPCLTDPIHGINTALLLYGKHLGGSKYDSGFLHKCNLPYPFERAKKELAKFGYKLTNISDVALRLSHDLNVKFQLEFNVDGYSHSSSSESASASPRTARKPHSSYSHKKEKNEPEKAAVAATPEEDDTEEKTSEESSTDDKSTDKSETTDAEATPEKKVEKTVSTKPVDYKLVVHKHRSTSSEHRKDYNTTQTRVSISDESRNSITRKDACEAYYGIIITTCEKGLLQKKRWESQKKFNVYDQILSGRIGNFYGYELLHGDETNVDEDKQVPSPLKKAQAYMKENHNVTLYDDTDIKRSRKVHLGLSWE